jgi:hypothetical protein
LLLVSVDQIVIVLFSVTCCFSRKKYPLDGSNAEVIIADVLRPTGIAIDPESDHLYIVDYNHNGTLLISDLNGANRTEILTGLHLPAAIVLGTINK